MESRYFRNRKNIRLRNWDYKSPGAYFITLCVYDRESLFGEVRKGKMLLNQYGEIADACWRKIPEIRNYVELDKYVVMPNHFHGILILKPSPVGATDPVARKLGNKEMTVATDPVAPTDEEKRNRATDPVAPTLTKNKNKNRPCGPFPGSVGAIIGQYKSVVTKEINALRRTPGSKVWQRDYYDRIGREERMLYRIRRYIRNNPIQWEGDEENAPQMSPYYVVMPNPQRQP
ncbi:MAG: hypothetical protein JXA71_00865 [Chitinispirillaceae bacterium]|nr:hypothetical protein [Chitinispirillaceae bacterium]